MRIAFFGTPHIAVIVLSTLEKAGILPSLVVTNPDEPQGRKMTLTPPPVKIWADEHNITCIQPRSLRDRGETNPLHSHTWDLFIVVAYGKIIPKEMLNIPNHGTLNLHPSLLPKLRGASPIRSAILEDIHETGVTIMLMDEEMDHGPIVAQEIVSIPQPEWPMRGKDLDLLLAQRGGALLAKTIPEWMNDHITPEPQDHTQATFCGKITKEMGEIDLSADPYQNLLKIRAFDGWPGTYFFTEKNGKRIRTKITDAELAPNGSLRILSVIPEGKKEMPYDVFIKN